ncbi:hypothetical protein L596_024784 [Steinernema carpocapsae]|uniref:Uncharacterized protein n=1 Tax=Steinernema carpocapsae TaxID=34508 RepID=A0A4U5M5R9_STECR|nr:hypothetical protein L596_024784 [Steinernema carpocapsae]
MTTKKPETAIPFFGPPCYGPKKTRWSKKGARTDTHWPDRRAPFRGESDRSLLERIFRDDMTIARYKMIKHEWDKANPAKMLMRKPHQKMTYPSSAVFWPEDGLEPTLAVWERGILTDQPRVMDEVIQERLIPPDV